MKRRFPIGTLARPSTFWLGTTAVGLVAAFSLREAELGDVLGFFVITTSALLPAALWCHGRAHGLPLFPIFTLGTIGTFALPLIAHHPLVVTYSLREKTWAALTIAGTNLGGTAAWWWLTRRPPPWRRPGYELRRSFGLAAFEAVLVCTIAFDLEQLALADRLGAPVFSMLRAIVVALSNLAVFLTAHRWGRGRLSAPARGVCGALLLAVIVSTLPSGLMVGALSYGVMALIGYALGRGRIPWLSLGALGAAALFLQAGKEDLRDKYWFSAEATPIGLADYPDMLADWVGFSCRELSRPRGETQPDDDAYTQSLVGRASLLQLFLRIQQMSPGEVPYLHGRTYAIIPRLLIPRVIEADKKRAHLGSYLLAIDYGLQTSEDTLTTTIGFGLINEAMANFGYAGCGALGIGLGLFYGGVARWSGGYPLRSLRSLLAILVLSVSFQNEFSASVYVTTLFQGACVVLALAPFVMRRGSAVSFALPASLAGAPA